MIQLRRELPDDIPAIRGINDRAFGQAQEGALVDRLREVCEGLLSLVAVEEAFMILVLDQAAMQGAAGVARYRSESDAAM